MLRFRGLFILASAAVIGAACYHDTGGGNEGSAAGTVIDPAEAAKTVVLHVDNSNPQPMELRTVLDGHSYFIGSVGGNDSTSILLEPTLFPTGFLYVLAIPADGRGRAVAGPLQASKGDKIRFQIYPSLAMSHAIVIR